MILTVADRINLLGILPTQGDFVTLQTTRNLQKELDFNAEEIDALKFEQQEGMIKWNAEFDPNKDCKIGERASDLIKSQLEKLDKEKKLGQQHFNLYEKFVLEK